MQMNKQLSARFDTLKKNGRRLLRRVRKHPDNRLLRTRLAYVLLSIGTVAVAYLLVLVNLGVFRLFENGLFGTPSYETVTIASAGAIADPLPRTVRVELYRNCTRQGDDRAPLPEERTKADVLASVRALWEQTIRLYADANGGALKTGESYDRILRGSKYTAHLRDFYNEADDAKIAIWSAQAYYTASNGRVYCLSAEFDSRMTDVYSLTVALFDSIDGSDPAMDFYPMLDLLGEPRSRAQSGVSSQTGDTRVTRLPLSDELSILRRTEPGVQFYLTLE